MYLDGLHEKGIFGGKYPFRLEINSIEGFSYPQHWHNAMEIIYVTDGNMEVGIGNRRFNMCKSDILAVPAGEIHGMHAAGCGKRYFIQFDIPTSDGLGDTTAFRHFITQTREFSEKYDKALHGCLVEQVEKIITEFERKEITLPLTLNARIYDILAVLSRESMGDDGGQDLCDGRKIYGLEKINRAFVYIEDNYREEITLKDVSKAAGFSEYHFSRVFKEIMGENFHNYLNEYRIKKAAKLLSTPGITIAQAAQEAGFNSFATFNRIFKDFRGITPSHYKRLLIKAFSDDNQK